MNRKNTIIKHFGTLRKFADLLRAPVNTIYSWTRPKDTRTPAEWQFDAYVDAAKYRNGRLKGWRCKNCGGVSVASKEGLPPKSCGFCACAYFTPVSVLPEDIKQGEEQCQTNTPC